MRLKLIVEVQLPVQTPADYGAATTDEAAAVLQYSLEQGDVLVEELVEWNEVTSLKVIPVREPDDGKKEGES